MSTCPWPMKTYRPKFSNDERQTGGEDMDAANTCSIHESG